MTCPHCGADAPPGERFCGNCGQALTVADATRPLTPAPAAYIGPESPAGMSASGPTPPPSSGETPPAARAPEQPTVMFPPASDQPAAPPYSPPPAYVPPPLAAPQPTTYTPTPAPAYGVATAKDPSTAMILEILLGLFGFLGIGHLYAGRTTPGIVLLLGWWVFLFVEAMLMFVVIGFCLLPANLIVPVISGVWLKNEMTRPPVRV